MCSVVAPDSLLNLTRHLEWRSGLLFHSRTHSLSPEGSSKYSSYFPQENSGPFSQDLKGYVCLCPALYIPGRSISTSYHLVISNLPQLGTHSFLQLQKIVRVMDFISIVTKTYFKNRNPLSKTNIICIQSNPSLSRLA